MRTFRIISLFLLSLCTLQGLPQNRITGYSWWFDGDDATDVVLADPVPVYTLEQAFPVTELETGLHTFHIRFRDDSARFSAAMCRFFFKPPLTVVEDRDVIACQYWIDKEFASAVTDPVGPGDLVSWAQAIDMTAVTDGLHTIHFRFLDNAGAYSPVLNQFFFKHSAQQGANAGLVAVQYWVDDAFDNAVTQDISATQLHVFTAGLDLSLLTDGIHIVNFRFRDDNGLWSAVTGRFVYKKHIPVQEEKEITAYRYWVDDSFDQAVEEAVSQPGIIVDITGSLDMTTIWKGDHVLHMQFRDDQGNWSPVIADEFEKLPIPVASFEAVTMAYCDSTVVTTVNTSVDGDEYYWDFGDGTTSTAFEPEHTYTEPGSYEISLTVTDLMTGQDSTVTESVSVSSLSTAAQLEVTACEAYTSPSGNHTWTASGIYQDTIPNAAGCDSVLTIDLTVNLSTFATIAESACDAYVSPSGNYTWTSSGTYWDTIPNAAGCDSVITVELTLGATTYATITETACDSYTSPSGNYTWSLSGSYHDTIPNAAGCDSIMTIDLTIVEVDTTVTNTDPVLTANASGATYQWLECPSMEPIPGATGQSYTATANGFYAVEVTQEGCIDTSACHQVLTVGIGHSGQKDFAVFPNPTYGKVTITFGRTVGVAMITVMDELGSLVLTKEVRNGKDAVIHLQGASGLYFLGILSDGADPVYFKVRKE